MSKKWYLFSVFLLTSFIIFMIMITPNTKNVIHRTAYSYQNKPVELPIGQLVIDKIHLSNQIYDFHSSENTVDKNVMLLDGSILPQKQNSSIIFLAAHSGTGSIAYFNDLDQLTYLDLISFQYKEINYIYEIVQIFEEDKDGHIEINQIHDHQLVLTTCSKHSGKQFIIVAVLQKKEKI